MLEPCGNLQGNLVGSKMVPCWFATKKAPEGLF